MNKLIEKEIYDLHQLFQAWYRGEMNREDLNTLIGIHLGDSFYIVFPNAEKQSKEELLTMMKGDYGNESSFRIEIRDVISQEIAPNVFLSQYEEWQFWREDKEPQLKLKTSSVLKRNENIFEWLVMHETEIK